MDLVFFVIIFVVSPTIGVVLTASLMRMPIMFVLMRSVSRGNSRSACSDEQREPRNDKETKDSDAYDGRLK